MSRLTEVLLVIGFMAFLAAFMRALWMEEHSRPRRLRGHGFLRTGGRLPSSSMRHGYSSHHDGTTAGMFASAGNDDWQHRRHHDAYGSSDGPMCVDNSGSPDQGASSDSGGYCSSDSSSGSDSGGGSSSSN